MGTSQACTMADEEVDFSVCAVLPAAGSGVRTGLETPKQVNHIFVLFDS